MMATVFSVFNNKGGVGKTTYMFHIAHILSRKGKRVLMVDCDTQGNLTSYCLSDAELMKAWSDGGNSIFRIVEPILKGTGDIKPIEPSKVVKAKGELYLIPGDLRLSDFEDRLGDSWNAALGGAEAPLRVQSAIYRHINSVVKKHELDVVLIDMGPNLGALNRAVLAGSDYFMTPVAPDLFSIQGTENLGSKLVTWKKQWAQVHQNWTGKGLEIPTGTPKYLGYVQQMHNIRNNNEGMTKGWQIYGKELESAIQTNIVGKIGIEQTAAWADGSFRLGQIPNLHSLVPYSQEAKLPIFDCTGAHGLNGAHQTKARDSITLFDDVISKMEQVIQ